MTLQAHQGLVSHARMAEWLEWWGVCVYMCTGKEKWGRKALIIKLGVSQGTSEMQTGGVDTAGKKTNNLPST